MEINPYSIENITDCPNVESYDKFEISDKELMLPSSVLSTNVNSALFLQTKNITNMDKILNKLNTDKSNSLTSTVSSNESSPKEILSTQFNSFITCSKNTNQFKLHNSALSKQDYILSGIPSNYLTDISTKIKNENEESYENKYATRIIFQEKMASKNLNNQNDDLYLMLNSIYKQDNKTRLYMGTNEIVNNQFNAAWNSNYNLKSNSDIDISHIMVENNYFGFTTQESDLNNISKTKTYKTETKKNITESDHNYYKCPSCIYITQKRDKLDKHIQKHVLYEGYHPCGKKRYKVNSPAKRHRHNAEEYKCPNCTYTCTVSKAYRKHCKTHISGENPISVKLSCKICGKDRSDVIEMEKHMKEHKHGKYFLCDLCNFGNFQLKKIIQHRRMHTGDKPHLCPHCNYRSSRRDNLRSHVRRMHRKENIYIDTFNPTEGNLLLEDSDDCS